MSMHLNHFFFTHFGCIRTCVTGDICNILAGIDYCLLHYDLLLLYWTVSFICFLISYKIVIYKCIKSKELKFPSGKRKIGLNIRSAPEGFMYNNEVICSFARWGWDITPLAASSEVANACLLNKSNIFSFDDAGIMSTLILMYAVIVYNMCTCCHACHGSLKQAEQELRWSVQSTHKSLYVQEVETHFI